MDLILRLFNFELLRRCAFLLSDYRLFWFLFEPVETAIKTSLSYYREDSRGNIGNWIIKL
jgi:hypothetical protein